MLFLFYTNRPIVTFTQQFKNAWPIKEKLCILLITSSTFPYIHSFPCGQPASKLSYLGEQIEPRVNEGPRKGELATISHKFSFPPWKPRDSARRENCHRKRAVDQKSDNYLSSKVQTAEGAQNYLFINRFRNSIKAMFFLKSLICFFSMGTSNFNVSARIRTH